DEIAFLRKAAASPDVRVVEDPGPLTADARAALVASLRTHTGIGLIASRDRALLDELTTATARTDRPRARLYLRHHPSARTARQAEGEARGRDRATAQDRHQARLAEQARHTALAAAQQRAATMSARGAPQRWKGNAAMRGRK